MRSVSPSPIQHTENKTIDSKASESTDKPGWTKPRGYGAAVVGVLLPAEPDATVLMIDESISGQHDAAGVPTEVIEDLLRAGDGPPRIADGRVQRPLPSRNPQKIAIGLSGEPVPFSTWSGAAENRNS